jgi:chaperone required for assembly of F1-ATPase
MQRPYLARMVQKLTEDWFPAQAEPAPDPIRAAQKGMRAAAPKRFYKEACVEEREGAFHLLLDGRPARTPARNPVAVPTPALGEALAAEWRAQGVEIDPAAMPLTRIVNSAIDGVEPHREALIDDLVRYAGCDLVCYRAGEPERLVVAQVAAWDPILGWARDRLGARFILSQGVMHVVQPEAALAAVRARLSEPLSPFRLAALHVMTTLAGSVLIALAHADGALGLDVAWAAAHVDELFQESLWGKDEEAVRRRAAREAEFRAASLVFALAG